MVTTPADRVFAQSIAGIRRSLGALSEVRAAIPDPDTAENTSRLIVESGLQNAVTAFQRLAETLYATLASSPKARRNAFQNLAEGSRLRQAQTGKSYRDNLSEDELNRLTQSFQQRHLIAHKQGTVDDLRLRKSGDTRYRLGQRVVVRAPMVRDTLELIERLVAGLETNCASLNSID